MAQPSYDPYYLLHHHHHHQQQQQEPGYYYHEPLTTFHDQIPTSKPITSIQIPKEKRHINTLFVSGLPDDVKPREIHNLFRRRPGFDSCQLKFTGRGNQVVAFITFFNHQSAVTALEALDGAIFDPETGSSLHIELARSNSRKRRRGSGPYFVIDERKRSEDDAVETSSDDGDNESDHPSARGDPDSSNNDVHSSAKSGEMKVDPNGTATASNEGTEKTAEGDLRPCSTLFIANLGPNCSEEELKQALSQFPGFNGLKLRAKGGMPVAFADYEEVEQATKAMEALQGTTLPSSDRGAMLIEYARSKMRKR